LTPAAAPIPDDDQNEPTDCWILHETSAQLPVPITSANVERTTIFNHKRTPRKRESSSTVETQTCINLLCKTLEHHVTCVFKTKYAVNVPQRNEVSYNNHRFYEPRSNYHRINQLTIKAIQNIQYDNLTEASSCNGINSFLLKSWLGLSLGSE
jgi:hypothetical protein